MKKLGLVALHHLRSALTASSRLLEEGVAIVYLDLGGGGLGLGVGRQRVVRASALWGVCGCCGTGGCGGCWLVDARGMQRHFVGRIDQSIESIESIEASQG